MVLSWLMVHPTLQIAHFAAPFAGQFAPVSGTPLLHMQTLAATEHQGGSFGTISLKTFFFYSVVLELHAYTNKHAVFCRDLSIDLGLERNKPRSWRRYNHRLVYGEHHRRSNSQWWYCCQFARYAHCIVPRLLRIWLILRRQHYTCFESLFFAVRLQSFKQKKWTLRRVGQTVKVFNSPAKDRHVAAFL